MTFDELCQVLLDPPGGTLHARVRWTGTADRTLYVMGGQYAWGPGPRVSGQDGGGEGVLELWKDGDRLRVELNGEHSFISDGEYSWRFGARPSAPQKYTAGRPGYTGSAYWLVTRPPAVDWSVRGDAIDGTVEEDTCGGRAAWKVTVGGVVSWFDRETRHTLALGFEDATFREELVEPEFGVALDDSLFTWDGPTVSPQEQMRQEREEKAARARSQMLENIASDLSPVPVTLELVPIDVPVHDDVTGEFHASGEGFSLECTLRAEERPDPHVMNDPSCERHQWSTPDHDWVLVIDSLACVDRAGMEQLWSQLHPGVPVDRYLRHRPEG